MKTKTKRKSKLSLRQAISIVCALSLVVTLVPTSSLQAIAEEASAAGGALAYSAQGISADAGAGGESATQDAQSTEVVSISQALSNAQAESTSEHTHVWDAGSVQKAATCGASGEMLYTCTVEGCGATRTEKIEATGAHTFSNGVCSVCGASELNYTVNVDGTLTITGSKTALTGALTIPASIDGKKVSAIGEGAFRRSSITSVTVPEGVTSIGKQAFYACLSLSKIYLPESLTSIGEQAFYSNLALCDIALPSSVLTWGKGAFDACASLRVPRLPMVRPVRVKRCFQAVVGWQR